VSVRTVGNLVRRFGRARDSRIARGAGRPGPPNLTPRLGDHRSAAELQAVIRAQTAPASCGQPHTAVSHSVHAHLLVMV
jgi:hypothetical protein